MLDGMAVTGSAWLDSVWQGADWTLAGSDTDGTGFDPWELWLDSPSTGHGFANIVTLIRQACAGRINWRLARLTHFSQYFSYLIAPVPLSKMKLFRIGASSGCIPFGGPNVRSVPRQTMT